MEFIEISPQIQAGNYAYKDKNYKEAIDDYRDAYKTDHPYASFFLAIALATNISQEEESFKIFKEGLKKHESILGVKYTDEDIDSAALASQNKVRLHGIVKSLNNANLFAIMGYVFNQIGKYNMAEEVLEKAFKLRSNIPIIYSELAEAISCQRLGDPNIDKLYEKAISLKSSGLYRSKCHTYFGYILFMRNKPVEAIEHYEKAKKEIGADLKPNFSSTRIYEWWSRLYGWWSFALNKLNKIEEAHQKYEYYHQINQNNFTILFCYSLMDEAYRMDRSFAEKYNEYALIYHYIVLWADTANYHEKLRKRTKRYSICLTNLRDLLIRFSKKLKYKGIDGSNKKLLQQEQVEAWKRKIKPTNVTLSYAYLIRASVLITYKFPDLAELDFKSALHFEPNKQNILACLQGQLDNIKSLKGFKEMKKELNLIKDQILENNQPNLSQNEASSDNHQSNENEIFNSTDNQDNTTEENERSIISNLSSNNFNSNSNQNNILEEDGRSASSSNNLNPHESYCLITSKSLKLKCLGLGRGYTNQDEEDSVSVISENLNHSGFYSELSMLSFASKCLGFKRGSANQDDQDEERNSVASGMDNVSEGNSILKDVNSQFDKPTLGSS